MTWMDERQLAALDRLRDAIRAAAPARATEGISYSMPAFLLDGKGMICYAAFNDHYSLFPMSTAVMTQHAAELGDRVTGKGTIRFEYGQRLPVTLVRKIVKARVRELDEQAHGHRER